MGMILPIRLRLTAKTNMRAGDGTKPPVPSHVAAPETPVTFCLPWPPSVNRLWLNRKGGGRRLAPQYAAYKETAARQALSAGVAPRAGRVDLTVWLHFPPLTGKQKNDTDGRLKALLDSMNGIAFLDDAQVRNIDVRRVDASENPRAVVTVTPVADRIADTARREGTAR